MKIDQQTEFLRWSIFGERQHSVLAAAQGPAWIEVAGGVWHPSREQLSAAEAALRSQLPAAAKDRGTVAKWSDYKFQYQGRSTTLGRNFIYINAFCAHGDDLLDAMGHPDFTQRWLEVMDGGACYFKAKYDPEKRRLYDLIVNGVA